MRRLDKKTNSKWLDAGAWFCVIALMGVLLTMCSLLQSHGENFPKIFFRDGADTGMDFFHSIEYTRGRAPYELFGTLYPPLANLFFLFLFQMVPSWQYNNWGDTFSSGIAMRRSAYDLRVYQPTMLLFMFFLIITAALLVILIQKCLKDTDPKKSSLIAFSALLTHGVLYGYERGNIVIIAVMCTLFFLLYYKSENRFLSELALLALAVAAGLKLYPAFFGLVLLYNKEYKKAIRTVIYGIAFFVLPVFAFHEGLRGLAIFFEKVTKFSSSSQFSIKGYGFDKLVNVAAFVWCKIWGITLNESYLLATIPKWNLVAAGVALLTGFTMKKTWQQALVCTVAMFLYNEQGVYGTMFFLVPLMLFIKDEKQLCLSNVVPFLAMTVFVVLLPIINSETRSLSYVDLRYQICHIMLILYILVQSGINIVGLFMRKRIRNGV